MPAVLPSEKLTVNIGLVYQSYTHSKVYDKAFKETIRNINNGQSISTVRRLAERFVLSPVDCILPRGEFYPSDVLKCLCERMISNKVALIIYVTSGEEFDESTAASQYFLHMAGQTGIPIIAFNADNSGYSFSNLAPPIEHQIRAMLALLKRYNWSKFGVVYSEIAGGTNFLKTISDEIRSVDNRSFRFEVVHQVAVNENLGEESIRERLDSLRKSEARIILLYSTTIRSRKIFEVARELNLTSENYLWIGTQSVRGSMKTVGLNAQRGMLSVNFHTLSHSMFPPPDDILHMIIGLAPKFFALGLVRLNPMGNNSMASTSSCSAVNSSAVWSMGAEIYENILKSSLKGNPYHPKDGHDSFVYSFDSNGKLRNSFLTISNARLKRDRLVEEIRWDEIGQFTNGELRMADIEWPGGRTNPPPGTPEKFHIRIVSLQEPPFVVVSELDPESGKCPGNQGSVCDWGSQNSTILKCCTGFCVDLLNKLAEDIGFTFTLYKVKDERWGMKENGSWNGLIRELTQRKAEMCVTSLKLNSERARDIDFSVPFMETGISIVVKIRSGVLSPTAFLEPFEYSIWLMILFVSIQTAALSIFLFEWLSPFSFNMKKRPPSGHKFSLFRSYWLVWATLFNASVSTDIPRSTVSRMMSLVWAAFSLGFLAVYTANLAAFMITRQQHQQLSGINDPQILNAEDKNPPFRYGIVEGGNTHETMRRNWDQINRYVENNDLFYPNVSAGIDAVKNDRLDAFIYDAVVLDWLSGRDANCELTTVGEWSSMTGYAIGFPKNSPYIDKVNHFMLQYQQKGDLERLQNFWLTGSCSGDGSGQTQSSPLGIENFMSAFLLLAAGMLAAIMCWGMENIYCDRFRQILRRFDPNGWSGIISMSMGKSISFSEMVDRVTEWQMQTRQFARLSTPYLQRRR